MLRNNSNHLDWVSIGMFVVIITHCFSRVTVGKIIPYFPPFTLDNIVFLIFICSYSFFNYKYIFNNFSQPYFKYLLGFTIYASSVNIYYLLKHNRYDFLINTGGLIVFFFFSVIFLQEMKKKQIVFHKSIFVALLFGSIISYLGIVFYHGYAFFQNPNQTGRFGFFVVFITYILYQLNKQSLNQNLVAFIIGLGATLPILGIRRAALLGLVTFLIIILFEDYRLVLKSISFCFILLMINYCIRGTNSLTNHLQNIENRFEENDQEDTVLGRGYDRIIEFPKYLVFGAGEGLFKRFSPINKKFFELHSTYGNLLFSYGIIGLILFLLYQFSIIGIVSFKYFYLVPVFFLTFFHNDFRSIYFVMMPILLGFLNRKHLKLEEL